MSTIAQPTAPEPVVSRSSQNKVLTGSPLTRGTRGGRIAILIFLIIAAALWLVPLLWTVYTSLRPNDYFSDHSYFSIGGHYGFQNYIDLFADDRFYVALKNNAELILFYCVGPLIIRRPRNRGERHAREPDRGDGHDHPEWYGDEARQDQRH